MHSNNTIFMHNKRINAPTTPATPHRRTASQACAACKYQRRKCASDCVLAPYFPHDRHRQFLNAHRLFGLSNIVKITRRLDPPAKDAAMRTIIFQSEARAADPIGGCYKIIRDLEQQIDLATAELEIVLHHLALCRAAAGRQTEAVPQPCYGDENNDVVVIDDGNSWSCMDVHAESSSSSSFHHDHHDLKIILENLSLDCGDDIDDGYKFEFHGNILPRFVNLIC